MTVVSVLEFLDDRVFRCRWKWLCDKWDERIRRGFECPGFTCGDRCEPSSCGPGDDHDQECWGCWYSKRER